MATANNAQKTPFALSIQKMAIRRANDAIQIQGRALPASVVAVTNSIVTVKFEINLDPPIPEIQVPMFGPEYIRYPIQTGCKGVVFPVDASIAAMSGLGSGVANLIPQANLSNLVFFPIGNKGWTATDDQNKIVIYGPDGAILRDAEKNAQVIATGTSLTLQFGANSIVIDSSGITFNGPINGVVSGVGNMINFGTANLTTSGEITSNGIVFNLHHHNVVGSSTGPALP